MSALEIDIAGDANVLVKDLHRTRPKLYWIDLFCSVAVGWASFAVAVASTRWTIRVTAVIICAIALYRALCFIHEISHQPRRNLPGFEIAWNATTGFPLLLPSFMYVGVHQSHHRLSTYGTLEDPEYLPFSRSNWMTLAFIAQSLLLPAALLIRFLLLAPFSLVAPRLNRWLVAHFSALSMNLHYCRDIDSATLRMIRRQTIGILLFWTALIALAAENLLPWKTFLIWYGVSAMISVANALRTLGAHAYRSNGGPLSREEQLLDSIDTPSAQWGVIWAPVGLRFHALHHYFPGIPYHNLGEAYRRLSTQLPAGAAIHKVRSPKLGDSLGSLYRRGHENRKRKA